MAIMATVGITAVGITVAGTVVAITVAGTVVAITEQTEATIIGKEAPFGEGGWPGRRPPSSGRDSQDRALVFGHPEIIFGERSLRAGADHQPG